MIDSALVAVMAGGLLGAAARYLLAAWALRQYGPGFPWGTLIINLTGCLALGIFAGVRAAGRHAVPALLTPALAVGFLGAYTTFSTFALDCVTLLESPRPALGLANLAASVGLGIFLAYLGLLTGRAL